MLSEWVCVFFFIFKHFFAKHLTSVGHGRFISFQKIARLSTNRHKMYLNIKSLRWYFILLFLLMLWVLKNLRIDRKAIHTSRQNVKIQLVSMGEKQTVYTTSNVLKNNFQTRSSKINEKNSFVQYKTVNKNDTSMIKQFTGDHKGRRVNRFKIKYINPKPIVLCYSILL